MLVQKLRRREAARAAEGGVASEWRLKTLLVLEAAFAGAYISMTRGYFYPMLAEAGFTVRAAAAVTAPAAALMLLVAYLLYRRPTLLEAGGGKRRLLLLHAAERAAWISMPLLLAALGPPGVLAAFTAAQALGAAVSAGVTAAMYSTLSEEEFRRIAGARSAAMLASSLVGSAAAFLILYAYSGLQKYVVLYLTAGGFAALSTLTLAVAPVSITPSSSSRSVSAEESVVAHLYGVALYTAVNLYNMSWTPYLIKVEGMPAYAIPILSAVATLAGAYASIRLARAGYRRLLAAASLLPAAPLAAVAADASLAGQCAVAALAAASTNSATLIFASIYAGSGEPVRSSARVVSANATGLLAASLLASLAPNYTAALLLASPAAAAAIAVLLLGVGKVSPLPPHVVRTYSRIIYETTLTTWRVTLEYSKLYLEAALSLAALALLAVTLYILYRAAFILLHAGAHP